MIIALCERCKAEMGRSYDPTIGAPPADGLISYSWNRVTVRTFGLCNVCMADMISIISQAIEQHPRGGAK
jgi:hypothetical protein